MTFEQARALFPVLAQIAYLNAGTFGPLATPTAEAMRLELERDTEQGRTGMPYVQRALELREQARAAIAGLVGADPAQLALTSSTTDGCNIVLAGLGLGRHDEIVTTAEEHFGLLGPLAVSGAKIIVAEADPDRILAAVTSRTRLLALSQVLWTTGRVLPVSELRARSGVPVLVDGAQSVGAIPVDTAGVDFLTVSGQKWLCGPDATGALFVADPERLRIASPSYFSQARHDEDGTFVPRDGAMRFERNWWPVSALAGMLAALATRPSWAFDRAAETADRCRRLLAPHFEVVVPDHRATLVAFRAGEDAAGLVERLLNERVHVREVPGTGLIRVSCGWWTSDGDLERLVAGLET
jgi:L-cysteine/cystine lyase